MTDIESFDVPIDRVTLQVDTCGGCRSCELACSFHHTKLFQRSLSSMTVTSIPGKLDHAITFYRESAGGRIACDMCKGLETPLCVLFCSEGFREELKKILEAHLSAPRDEASES